MQLRRTPTRSRVADAWLRRTGDTRPSGGDPMFKEFLKSEGGRKVRAPGHENEVLINTLNSSDEPADKKRLQEEYAKWSGGDDDTTTKGRGVGVIDSPQKLKAVQDELVEDAVNFGVPEATAREMVRGLVVGDDDSSVVLVERNLQKVIDKAVGDKQKADAEAAEKAKADADEKVSAEAKVKIKTPAALKALQDDLVAQAVEDGVPEKDARELVKGMNVGDTAEDIAQVEKALQPLIEKALNDAKEKAKAEAKRDRELQRRNQVRERAQEADSAFESARASLEEAKKSKDKAAIQRAEEVFNKAESMSLSESAALTQVEVTEAGEAEAAATLKAQEAAAKATAGAAELTDAQAAFEAAKDTGDPDAIREAEEKVSAAQEAFDKADAEKRELDASLEGQRAEERQRKAEVAKRQFEKAWAHAEKNRGVLLTDAEGKTVRYNPERSDKVYEFMMALLGEEVTKRNLPTLDTTTTTPNAASYGEEGGGSEGGGKSKGKGNKSKGKGNKSEGKGNKSEGKSKGDAPSGPTKSGKPRRPDGSSPTGGETEDYGPGEFWMINPNMWSAKDSKGNHRTFGTMAGAKAYAKTASSMPSRVASRYLRRNGR